MVAQALRAQQRVVQECNLVVVVVCQVLALVVLVLLVVLLLLVCKEALWH
jgi:hypothetical protein